MKVVFRTIFTSIQTTASLVIKKALAFFAFFLAPWSKKTEFYHTCDVLQSQLDDIANFTDDNFKRLFSCYDDLIEDTEAMKSQIDSLSDEIDGKVKALEDAIEALDMDNCAERLYDAESKLADISEELLSFNFRLVRIQDAMMSEHIGYQDVLEEDSFVIKALYDSNGKRYHTNQSEYGYDLESGWLRKIYVLEKHDLYSEEEYFPFAVFSIDMDPMGIIYPPRILSNTPANIPV